MGIKFVKGRLLPIGLDLGTNMLKMAQLRLADEAIGLIAAGAAEIPRTLRKDAPARMEFMSKAIRNILKTNAFKGRQCILSLPAESTFVQPVRIPKLPAEEIPKALRFELQGKLPFPIAEAIIRHVVAGDIFGDGDAKQEVIVFATSKTLLDQHLEMAARAKLDVIGVNVESCAVVECFSRLFRRAADAARPILFLDIGEATTQVVLSHGDQVVFARNLLIGGEQFDQAVSEGLGIPLEQARSMRRDLSRGTPETGAEEELYHHLDRPLSAMADELTQCLRYYESVFRNQSVERAIFVGGQAYDKRLCQSLAQRLNLPAQVGDPLVRMNRIAGAGLQHGLDRREPQPNWAVAVGLSLGARSGKAA
jgi:type IV pilus assembly protein PilM